MFPTVAIYFTNVSAVCVFVCVCVCVCECECVCVHISSRLGGGLTHTSALPMLHRRHRMEASFQTK